MQESPHNEGPVGSVPNAADKKSDYNVEIVLEFGAMASAETYVDVGGEPAC